MTAQLRHRETRTVSRQTETERRCIVSGARSDPRGLLRFVVAPDGTLVPDIAGRLPGRGIWITPQRRLLEQALKRKLFERASRRRLEIPADLPERVGELLRRRCLDLLGMARRAGLVDAGHDKVKAVLRGGEAVLLLQACDAATGGRKRLAALGRGLRSDLAVVERFSGAELGAALGRSLAVHVAVRAGGAAERLRAEIARLDEYETNRDGPAGARK